MLSMKKIDGTYISYVSSRRDWSPGTVYAQYDDQNATISSNNFFVLTDDYNVYKSLYNNNGATSTAKPSGTSNTSITTVDGYIWKYMFTVTSARALKFLTSNYIPVQTLTADDGTIQWDIQQQAANSSIESALVSVAGTGYYGHSGVAQVGNTSTITLAVGASAVSNAYANCAVYISSGTGSGQIREIANYNQTTKVATVVSNFSTAPDSSSNYIIGPRLVFTGDGSGVVGYTTVSGTGLNKVTITNIGSDYSYADCVVIAKNGSGGVVRPVVSPLGGHGSDAVEELYAYNIMLNIILNSDEGGNFTTNNDFRIFGLVSDPILTANGSVATASTYDMTTSLTIGSITGTFTKDEVVAGGTSGANGYVVEYKNGNTLKMSSLIGSFTNGEVVTGITSSATATITSITNPDIKKYSGDVLYIENRSPITRAEDQQETIRIIIRY